MKSAIISLIAVCYSVTGLNLIAPCVFETTIYGYTWSLLLEGINYHFEGRFNVDVTGLAAYISELRIFPNEVYELIPNLQSINFQRNDLRRVDGRTFANRTNLMSPNLHRNRLN